MQPSIQPFTHLGTTLKRVGPALALAAPATVGLLATSGPAHADGGTTYYVSPTGSDAAAGTSDATAWRTLARASQAPLGPGDHLWLRGGATYSEPGGLTVGSGGASGAPATVESYGGGVATVAGASGSCISVHADWVTVHGVAVAGCGFAGVELDAAHGEASNVDASGSEAGVYVAGPATYTTVAHDVIHDNTRMAPGKDGPDDDSGAFGVLVNGDQTTISDNVIDGQDAPSADYGRDGSAVEVFGAVGTTIERNTASGNQTFVEIGGLPGTDESSGVQVLGNTVATVEDRTFFVTAHAGDQFGAASGIVVDGNVATLPAPNSAGVVCGPVCPASVLRLGANTLATPHPVQIMGG